MSKPDMGGPAFPSTDHSERLPSGDSLFYGERGMTLWDYYAAAAVSGIEASQGVGGSFVKPDQVAKDAAATADAMLAERAKRIGKTELG